MPLAPRTGIFLGPEIGQDRGADQPDSGTVTRRLQENLRLQPGVNIDDGWIPVKNYIEEDLGVNTRSWR